MIKICIFNVSTFKREYKSFRSKESANMFFDKKLEKNKNNLICDPKSNCFTYFTEFGNRVFVQKMY